MSENKYEKKISAGSVSATVWANKVQKGDEEVIMKTTTISKNYKDKEDQWKQSNSFTLSDLSDLDLVVRKTREYLRIKE